MTAKQIEAQVRQLSSEELRLFAHWWETHRASLLVDPAAEASHDWEPTAEQKAEVLRRREELRRQPETLVAFEEADCEQLMREIADAHAKKTSSGAR